MQLETSSSVEISIAVLSWINDHLRDSAEHSQPKSKLFLQVEWLQNVVTVLAAGLIGGCVMVLQHWT